MYNNFQQLLRSDRLQQDLNLCCHIYSHQLIRTSTSLALEDDIDDSLVSVCKHVLFDICEIN